MRRLSWYINRLRAMTPQEFSWRLYTLGRAPLDRLRLRIGLAGKLPPRLLEGAAPHVGFPLLIADAGRRPGAASDIEQAEALLRRGDRVRLGCLSYLGLGDHPHGQIPDWNRDHAHQKAAPRCWSSRIDYRDFEVTGDCKLVWELNRHHHWVVLARAYRRSREPHFAQTIAAQWRNWLDECPFGYGMNWRSGLELGVRLINWVAVLELLGDAQALTPNFRRRIFESMALHVWMIRRSYSRASSANNHLIGEAAGVYIASRFLGRTGRLARYAREARRILEREILRQTYVDGGTREQATSYLFFVSQFFLLSGLAGQRSNEDFSRPYWQRLERVFDFLAALLGESPRLPAIGDSDDGYVLDLDTDPHDVRPWLGAAAAIFECPEWAAGGRRPSEAAGWLLSDEQYEKLSALRQAGARRRRRSQAFRASGYYLLRGAVPHSNHAMRLLFDCGELGYGPLAAHGHADALSFTLRLDDLDVLVDPGTYDYFTYPAWREYFRKTRAHNTIEIDGRDQAEILGPFQWGRRYRARCLKWKPSRTGGHVVGEHDGYTSLKCPVTHRRALTLDGGCLTLIDTLKTDGEHEVRFHLHFSEHCRIESLIGGRLNIAVAKCRLTLDVDPRLDVQLVRAAPEVGPGWLSPGYHRRTPSVSIIGHCRMQGPLVLKTTLSFAAAALDSPRLPPKSARRRATPPISSSVPEAAACPP